MKTFHIWYMRPEWFPQGILGLAKPDPKNLDATHIFLLDLRADNLERVFSAMQGEVWSPNGEARPLIERKGLTHTSMSVGDVVVVNGRAFLVAGTGFEDLGGLQ